MKLGQVDPRWVLYGGGAIALGLVALWIWKKGGIAAAAGAAGAGAVNAAGAAVSGAVGAIGAGVGLPTPADTTTDASVARWIIDNYGYLKASAWSGAPALFEAITMPAGSGTPPPIGGTVARGLGWAGSTPSTGDFARQDRAIFQTPTPEREVIQPIDPWGFPI